MQATKGGHYWLVADLLWAATVSPVKSYGCAQGRGQAKAHAAQAARGRPLPGPVKLVVLCSPHLVLAHSSGDDCVSLGLLVQHLHTQGVSVIYLEVLYRLQCIYTGYRIVAVRLFGLWK